MAHLSQSDLKAKLDAAKSSVEIGKRYTHYRQPDQAYRVEDLVILEADDAVGVVYQAEYGEKITFVRNLDSWTELVDEAGKSVPRFAPIVEYEA